MLASVPGTDEAAEAVLLAQIPQTARVDKKQVKAPEVQYQGNPQFEPIPQTTVARAANTDKDIIKVGDLYYMCFQGVWFMGRSPNGPWEVTGSVPGQIYEIPISSPSYHVTNVTVVEDNSDAVVFATAAAYTGLMIGVGLRRVGHRLLLSAVRRVRRVLSGTTTRTTRATATTPRTTRGPVPTAAASSRVRSVRRRRRRRRATTRGPAPTRAARRRTVRADRARSPAPTTRAPARPPRRRQGSNVYGSWGQTGVQRGDQWASTSRVTNNRTGATTRVTQGSGGGAAVTRNPVGAGGGGVARTGSGDVYAGRDGNVYKKYGRRLAAVERQRRLERRHQPTPQQREQAQQRATDARSQAGTRAGTMDASTVGQLNRDSAARAEGAQRTQDRQQSPPRGAARRAAIVRAAAAARDRSAGGGGGGRRR